MRKTIIVMLLSLSSLTLLGNEWERIGIQIESEGLNDIRIITNEFIVTVGNYGIVKRSIDSGKTWEITRGDFKYGDLFGIDYCKNSVFAVGANGTLLESKDLGNSWTNGIINTNEDLFSIAFHNNIGLIAGDNGILFRTTDCGDSWQQIEIGKIKKLNQVFFLENETAFIIGDEGILFRSIDQGETWEQIDLEIVNDLICYSISPSGTIFIGGKQFIFISSDDDFNTWSLYNSTVIPEIFGSILSINNDLILAGIFSGGSILHSYSKDGGKTWNNGYYPNVPIAAFDRKESVGVLCGTRGSIIKIDLLNAIPDNFWFFEEFVEFGDEPITFSKITGTDEKYLLASNQTDAYYSQDSGVSWKKCLESTKTISALYQIDNNTFLAIVDSTKRIDEDGKVFFRHWPIIFSSEDEGESWTQVNPIDSFEVQGISMVENYGIAYGVPKFLKTTDYGKTWEVNSIFENYFISDLQVLSEGKTYILSWQNDMYNLIKTKDDFISFDIEKFYFERSSIAKIFFVDDLTGWLMLGNIYNKKPNKIYKTSDGGESWTEQLSKELLLAEGFMNINFADKDHGICLASQGITYITKNSGITWTEKLYEGYGSSKRNIHYPNPTIAYISDGTGIYRHIDTALTSVEIEKNSGNSLSIMPNPISEAAAIIYNLETSSDVRLAVYDIIGNEIQILVDEFQIEGIHKYNFNFDNLASGTYFISLKYGVKKLTERMILLK